MAVRPFTNTSSTELSRQTCICSCSSTYLPVASTEVNSVCGANSEALLISSAHPSVEKEGRSIVNVSLAGENASVVVLVKSNISSQYQLRYSGGYAGFTSRVHDPQTNLMAVP